MVKRDVVGLGSLHKTTIRLDLQVIIACVVRTVHVVLSMVTFLHNMLFVQYRIAENFRGLQVS